VCQIGALVLCALWAAPAQAQGFGVSKTIVTLHRKLPPIAPLSGTTFQVEVKSPDNPEAGQQLKSTLEAELIKRDPRLRVANKDPETLISCTLTKLSVEKPTETVRSTFANGKSGNQTVYRYTGSLDVQFGLKQANGRTPDSGTLAARYDREFVAGGAGKSAAGGAFSATLGIMKSSRQQNGEAPPTEGELKNALLSDLVSQIAARLVGIDDTVNVPLARGKFDEANKLAEAGLWNRYLETLETMTLLPIKEEDAYRYYNIAVAYEALGYAATSDLTTVLTSLQSAATVYDSAVHGNPNEPVFRTAALRVETTIAPYRRLLITASASRSPASSPSAAKGHQDETHAYIPSDHSATGKSGGSSGSSTWGKSSSSASAASGGAAAPFTNEQVILMLRSGWDDERLADTIRAAASVNFDLSAEAQVNLMRNGVNSKVLMAMKERSSRGPAEQPSPPPQLVAGGEPPPPAIGSVPDLPWPPPEASATIVLPGSTFQSSKNYGEIEASLNQALSHTGYVERSYYNVPGGFAVVTRMERIYDDGRPDPAPERWQVNAAYMHPLSLNDYVHALFSARVGYYRVLVFVVTDQPFRSGPATMTASAAQSLLVSGANVPAADVMKQPVPPNYACTALIYEFRKQEQKQPEFVVPGHLDARTHLMQAGLWLALGLPRL
jgi:hypothetical protein